MCSLLPKHLSAVVRDCRGRARLSALRLHPLTLRFRSEKNESAFMEERKGPLVLATFICAGLMVVASAVEIPAIFLFNESGDRPEVDAVFCLLVLMSSLSFFALVVSGSDRLAARLRPEWLECFWICQALILIACVPLAQLTWAADAFRSHLHLAVAATISAAHACLPIRWFTIASLGALAVVAAAFSSPSTDAIWLLAVAVASSIARRSYDHSLRLFFLHMADEQERCKNEMSISFAPRSTPTSTVDEGCQSCQVPASVGRLSIGSSTSTGRLFNVLFDMDKNPVEALTRLAELGREERWSISGREMRILQENPLGRGGCGKVIRGVWLGMMVAVKIPLGKLSSSDLKKLPSLANELRILRHLRHPNLVMMHGAIIEPTEQSLAIVLELLGGVTLHKFVSDKLFSNVQGTMERYQLMLGVSSALYYLHSHNPQIVHGDLKPQNIMVDRTPEGVHPKILDFGLSRVITKRSRPSGGTLGWTAPESFDAGQVRCSADVYAFGCLLGFIAAGTCPASANAREALKRAVRLGNALPLPAWPETCVFAGFRPLALACVEANQHMRPTMRHVHRHLLSLHQELDLEAAPIAFQAHVQTLTAAACEGEEITYGRSVTPRATPYTPEYEISPSPSPDGTLPCIADIEETSSIDGDCIQPGPPKSPWKIAL